MRTVVKISPVTRIEGHLDVEITVDAVDGEDRVVDARVGSPMFRGFETILQGRDPRDAVHYTQRVCGVCPVAHGMASSLALEQAYRVVPPANGRILRNLVLGANYLQSHVLHFYHLAALDFIDTSGHLDMSPWVPRHPSSDLLGGDVAKGLIDHYVQALAIRRKAHQMGAIFAGRMPSTASFVCGGASAAPTAEQVIQFRALLDEISAFVDDVYIPDVGALEALFPEYKALGRGSGNLLSFGVFDLDAAGGSKLLARGRSTDGVDGEVLHGQVREYVAHSWYAPGSTNLTPSAGLTEPMPEKESAYSWIKAPRYEEEVHEVGPLARMWVNGDYRRGISVIDRHAARALEARKVAGAMQGWLDQVVPGDPVFQHADTPVEGVGVGMTEAARGALGHWVEISDQVISRYQLVTPTGWNASPRDDAGKQGAMEQALVGTPIADLTSPIEPLRVIHSFDPCVACSVHLLRPGDAAGRHAVHIESARTRIGARLIAVAMALALVGTPHAGAVDIPLLQIGDPGNPPDATGLGSLDSGYWIGATEVTNGQYAAFLGAVASDDPNGLYNPAMAIVRSGEAGSYAYTTTQADRPVTHVSWHDALRFVNWLHNGQPAGSQSAATTEDGAYTFTGPAEAGPREPGALYFLPSEDEWYKAAYYEGGAAPRYWLYPTRSDDAPTASAPSGAADVANYDGAVGGVSPVGSYPAAVGPWGTLDQAGNVWEWTETDLGGLRGIRGGSWDDYASLLDAWYRDADDPASEHEFLGFRVASSVGPTAPRFRRGDVNQDAALDISDGVAIFGYLFLGAARPACVSAADANDDGSVDISDGVTVLNHLFLGGASIPEPFASCGTDPTPDELDCVAFPECP